jgi:hypothetical protein
MTKGERKREFARIQRNTKRYWFNHPEVCSLENNKARLNAMKFRKRKKLKGGKKRNEIKKQTKRKRRIRERKTRSRTEARSTD